MNVVLERGAADRDTVVSYLASRRAGSAMGNLRDLATRPEYSMKRIVVHPGRQSSPLGALAERRPIEIGATETESLSPGQHAHIPLRACRRPERRGREPLVFMEIQVGEVLTRGASCASRTITAAPRSEPDRAAP